MTHPWQPIGSAPKEAVIDAPAHDGVPRLRMGEQIALLGWFDQTFIVLRGCWAAADNNEHWWNLENEEPIDFDVVGWAALPDEGATADLMRASGFNPRHD